MTEAAANSPQALETLQRSQLDHIAEVIRYRLTLCSNGLDGDHCTDPKTNRPTENQITYLADANVFYFFVNTSDRREYLKADALPRVTSRWLKRQRSDRQARQIHKHNIAPAAITAQYIFSGALPGQRGFPLYIADEHATEFQGRISHVYKSISEGEHTLSEDKKKELKRAAYTVAKRMVDLIKAAPRDAKAAGKIGRILDQEIPELIRKYDLDKVGQALYLLYLMEGDVARPLRLAPGIDREVLARQPDAALVQAWEARLASYHPSELYLDDNRDTEEQTINHRKDAQVLARLEEMNRVSHPKGNRFVLITTSNAVLSANAHWLHETGQSLDCGLVRSLNQFGPELNLRDMPSFSNQAEKSTQDLSLAMDALFQWKSHQDTQEAWAKSLQKVDIYIRGLNRMEHGLKQTQGTDQFNDAERRALKTLHSERTQQFLTAVNGQKFDRHLDFIAEQWSGLVENSVGYHARMLVEHYARHLNDILHGIEQISAHSSLRQEIGGTYVARQVTLAERVARAHLRMASRLMLGGEPDEQQRYANSTRALRLEGCFDGKVAQLMDKILKLANGRDIDGVEKGLMQVMSVSDAHVAEQALAASATALQLGLWDNAANFARQAESLLTEAGESAAPDARTAEETAFLIEAYWLIGVAQRIGALGLPADPASARAALINRLGRAFARHGKLIEMARETSDHAAIARSEAETALIQATLMMVDLARDRMPTAERIAEAYRIADSALFMVT
ncbi:MAG: hypothetical protein AAF813_00745, partial [Pseudomonadota bacterium]